MNEFDPTETEFQLIRNECEKYDINPIIMINKLKKIKNSLMNDYIWKNLKNTLRYFGYGQMCGGNYSFYGVFKFEKGEISIGFGKIDMVEDDGYDVYVQKKGYKYPKIQHFDNKINAAISAQNEICSLYCNSNDIFKHIDFEKLTNEGEENSYKLIDKITEELYVKIWYKKTLQ